MNPSLVVSLLIVYILIMLAVIAYLVRRSFYSQNGYLARLFHRRNDNSPETERRDRLFRKTGHVKLKEQNMMPYSYEVVKAQLPYGVDENVFFTEVSRVHMTQHKLHEGFSSAWRDDLEQSSSIQERRNIPQLYLESLQYQLESPQEYQKQQEQIYSQQKILHQQQHPHYRNKRKSASDELKENSTNNFKEENIYQKYHDIENNELTLFNESLSRSDSVRSLNEEFETSSSHSSTPSSSRSSSKKNKSPLTEHHSPFEKMTFKVKGESSSFKEKLKKKLSRSVSNDNVHSMKYNDI
eukprot:TCONS_00007725-protein